MRRTRQDYLDALAVLREVRDALDNGRDTRSWCEADRAVRALARALDAAYPPDTTPGPVALGGRLP